MRAPKRHLGTQKGTLILTTTHVPQAVSLMHRGRITHARTTVCHGRLLCSLPFHSPAFRQGNSPGQKQAFLAELSWTLCETLPGLHHDSLTIACLVLALRPSSALQTVTLHKTFLENREKLSQDGSCQLRHVDTNRSCVAIMEVSKLVSAF